MARIRALVADASPAGRRRLVAALSRDPAIEVVGEATDGPGAVALARTLRPDVVALDVGMPALGGLMATEQIMAYHPVPILVVTTPDHPGDMRAAYDALAAGAVEAIERPRGDEDGGWDARFAATVKLIARIKVITHPRARLRRGAQSAVAPSADLSAPAAPVQAPKRGVDLVVLGASTGGPGAVARVLRGLPPGFRVPVLVVIHVGEAFGGAMAAWLDGLAPVPVRLAVDGEPLPRPGRCEVLVAPPERHLELEGGTLRLTAGPERHFCRPSVDVLFESAARALGARAAGCLLTGMGRDGAAGLLALRQAGAPTIAQDEASSVVYGMPREAARLGAAAAILPLDEIGPALGALAGGPVPGEVG